MENEIWKMILFSFSIGHLSSVIEEKHLRLALMKNEKWKMRYGK
jgi:hypothetical protein